MLENKKQKRPRLLIYCEGETEKQYLTGIVKTLKITNNVSILRNTTHTPISLLESAFKDFQWSQVSDKQYPFTEYWVVFNRNHHSSYEDALKLARALNPMPHLVWSNPCVEFWYWLHFCGNRNLLKFDEQTEVSNVRSEKVLDNDEVEITIVRRVRRTITSETMLELLRSHLPEYNKASGPLGLIPRITVACENLNKVAQDKNPMLLGSSMPDLLLRLANLQEEIYPPKTQPNAK